MAKIPQLAGGIVERNIKTELSNFSNQTVAKDIIGQAGHWKPNLSDYFLGSRFSYWPV